MVALLHAFGQKITGQSQFSFYDLEGGVPNDVFHQLVSGLHIYNLQIPLLATNTSAFHDRITGVLQQFDPKKQAGNITIIQNQGSFTDFGSLEEKALFGILNRLWDVNHAISLEGVIKHPDGKIKAIRISNPAYTGKLFEIPYPHCLQYIGELQIGSIAPIS